MAHLTPNLVRMEPLLHVLLNCGRVTEPAEQEEVAPAELATIGHPQPEESALQKIAQAHTSKIDGLAMWTPRNRHN